MTELLFAPKRSPKPIAFFSYAVEKRGTNDFEFFEGGIVSLMSMMNSWSVEDEEETLKDAIVESEEYSKAPQGYLDISGYFYVTGGRDDWSGEYWSEVVLTEIQVDAVLDKDKQKFEDISGITYGREQQELAYKKLTEVEFYGEEKDV